MKTKKRNKYYLVIIDACIIILSLLCAYYIRSRFEFFLFKAGQLAFILPYVVLLRLIVNMFFEHYNLSLVNFQLRDISSLFIHNTIPSFIFILIRLLSPVSDFRLPYSMVFTEFFFSVSWMILVRLLIVNMNLRRTKRIGAPRKNHALLVYDPSPSIASDLSSVQERYGLEFAGILNNDRLAWNTDHQGIRILGGYSLLEPACLSNGSINTVIMEEGTNARDKLLLLSECRRLALHVYMLKNGRVVTPEIADFVQRDFSDFMPAGIQSGVRIESISILGNDSSIAKAMNSLTEKCGFIPDIRRMETLTGPRFAMEIEEHLGSDLIVDLRLAELFEHGLLSAGGIKSFIDDVESIRESLGSKNGAAYCILSPASADMRIFGGLENVDNLYVLFTESAVLCASKGVRFIDDPGQIAAAVFKAMDCAKSGARRFYFKSIDALSVPELKKIEDLLLLRGNSQRSCKPNGICGATEETQNSHEWPGADCLLKPTSYSGLFELEKNPIEL